MENPSLYIILLGRDRKRVSHVNKVLIPALLDKHANITRRNISVLSAIDGNTNSLEVALQKLNVKSNENNKIGTTGKNRCALACTLSHMMTWKSGLDHNYDHLIVLEDDAIVGKNFWKNISLSLKQLPNNYDLLYLFIHPRSYNIHAPPIFENSIITEAYETYGTVGYMISRNGMNKLMHIYQEIDDRTDEMLLRSVRNKDINAYSLIQPICGTVGQLVKGDNKNLLPSNVFS